MYTVESRGRWTPERKVEVVKLWQEGLSASQIAKQLNCGASRNAVIGILHRMGEQGRGRASPAGATRIRRPQSVQKAQGVSIHSVRAAKRRSEGPKPPPVTTAMRQRAWEPLEGSYPRPWETRLPTECKWPIGEQADACCLPKQGHAHYCPAHRALATGRTSEPVRKMGPGFINLRRAA